MNGWFGFVGVMTWYYALKDPSFPALQAGGFQVRQEDARVCFPVGREGRGGDGGERRPVVSDHGSCRVMDARGSLYHSLLTFFAKGLNNSIIRS